ncbi:hypothetical protein CEXT_781621 [Caerostris extrusa]|uniref:Uncharacterized protein n=1 Tax=Caerostris extrusa TaxID=172846 RepID=A0AAV4UKD2_CAEEX|nr:hypothetical protein CEXT_781621 [Caerostris extrusa]
MIFRALLERSIHRLFLPERYLSSFTIGRISPFCDFRSIFLGCFGDTVSSQPMTPRKAAPKALQKILSLSLSPPKQVCVKSYSGGKIDFQKCVSSVFEKFHGGFACCSETDKWIAVSSSPPEGVVASRTFHLSFVYPRSGNFCAGGQSFRRQTALVARRLRGASDPIHGNAN